MVEISHGNGKLRKYRETISIDILGWNILPSIYTYILHLFENEKGDYFERISKSKDLYSLGFSIREDLRSRGFTNGAPTNKLTRRSRYKGKFQRVQHRLRVIRSIYLYADYPTSLRCYKRNRVNNIFSKCLLR